MLRIISISLCLLLSHAAYADNIPNSDCDYQFDIDPNATLISTIVVDNIDYFISWGEALYPTVGYYTGLIDLEQYDDVSSINIWSLPNNSILIIFLDSKKCVISNSFILNENNINQGK